MSVIYENVLFSMSKEITLPVTKDTPTIELRRSFAVQVNTPTPYEAPSVTIGKDITAQVSYPLLTGDLVSTATAFINSTASVLPINEEDDRYIDRLVADKYGDAPVKKLSRRV